jgi:Ca2+-binding EF-hand superfamily protein
MFREVMKRTFTIIFTSNELAAMIAEFNNGNGNIDTSKFLVTFIKMGSEERDKAKGLALEKERNNEIIRKTIEKKKKVEQENKMLLKTNYSYTKEQKEEAFLKLAIAAKKYDKSHPAAMSLDGFIEKSMKPHIFREMLKRTFNFIPSPEELGAIVEYFDKKKKGEIISSEFLIYFLKLGIAEREKEHKESLKKLREETILREKQHQEKIASQWSKSDMILDYSQINEEDKESALEKLTEASVKFDPSTAGPMGLTAFQASSLSPHIFREMLRRVFNMQLTNGEFVALTKEFDKYNNLKIDCQEFIIKFQYLGNERKNQIRAKQLEKQRYMSMKYDIQMEENRKKLDSKLEITLDMNFSNDDFEGVIEKIRQLATHYDKNHPSAPNLKGFMGADMKPNEFKDMIARTFHISLNNKELAALVAYFPGISSGSSPSSKMIASGLKKGKAKEEGSNNDGEEGESNDQQQQAEEGDLDNAAANFSSSLKTAAELSKQLSNDPRICNRDFLTYFYRINREEMMKRNSRRIQEERLLKQQEKVKNNEIENQKIVELIQKLLFHASDELSCLEKLKAAVREYTIDSAPFIPLLQGFKGPALAPEKFRDLFYRIFNVRFTYPEIGVLLSILDNTGLRIIDGTKFLNWFYKISRKMEAFMLGESTEDITLEMIKSDDMTTGAGGMNSRGSTSNLARTSSFMSANSAGKRRSSTGGGGNRRGNSSHSPSSSHRKKGGKETAEFTINNDYFYQSKSFEVENPLHYRGISPSSVSGDETMISQSPYTVVTQTSEEKHRKSASTPGSYLPPSSSPSHNKGKVLQVKHSSLLEASTGSPSSPTNNHHPRSSKSGKRTKGFNSLSMYGSHSFDSYDDFSVESMNDTSSFARSTLSQQWFLPSIALPASSSNYQSSSIREQEVTYHLREELKELFERKEDSLDFSFLEIGNERGFIKTAPSVTNDGRTSGRQQQKRSSTMKSVKSESTFIVPNVVYGSLGNSQSSPSLTRATPSSAKQMEKQEKENDERPFQPLASSSSFSSVISNDDGDNVDNDFLKSVFEKSEINDPSLKIMAKGTDPIAKLTKISHHLHASPMAVVSAKQQKQKQAVPSKLSSSSKLTSSMEEKKAESLKATSSLTKKPSTAASAKKDDLTRSASIDESNSADSNGGGGGFFFPTLLTGKISSTTNEDEQQQLDSSSSLFFGNVPNISIAGESEIDSSYLKQIILS